MSSPVEIPVGHLGLHGCDVELRWLAAALATARRSACWAGSARSPDEPAARPATSSSGAPLDRVPIRPDA